MHCDDDGDYHRFFAVEPLIDVETKIAVYPLICTQCGTLLTRVVDFLKIIGEAKKS